MTLHGPARVSTVDQDPGIQEAALRAAGCRVVRTEERSAAAAGKAFPDMLGMCAELETTLRGERQAESTATAKAKGVYKGQRPRLDPAEMRLLREAEGLGASDRQTPRH